MTSCWPFRAPAMILTRRSPDAGQRELAAPAGEEHLAQAAVGGIAQLGIGGDDDLGFPPGLLEERRVADQVGDAELRQPRLARAEELARAAQLEIGLGDLEPVGGRHNRVDAPLRVLAEGRAGEQDAVGLPRSAADAPAELVE